MNLRLFIMGISAFAAVATAGTNWVGVVTHPVKDEATHAMLREMLGENDPVAREEALRALANIRDPNDTGLILHRLSDPQARVRVMAVRAVAALGITPQPAELAKLVRDSDAPVRAAVMTALPDLAVTDKLDCLQQGLADADVTVRRAAAQMAAVLPGGAELVKGRWATETDGTAANAMFRLAAQDGSAQLLQQALANDHPAVVVAALDAAHAAVSELVVEKLDDPATVVAEAAVRAIGRLQLAKGVRPLLKKLPAADTALRPEICVTLGVLGGASATAVLAQRLADDPDLFTQQAAANALLTIHTDTAREELVLLLENPRATTRRETVRVLGQWKSSALATNINPLLTDPEPAVAAAAAEALGRLRHPSSRPLLLERLVQGPVMVQERVAWALGQYRAREAVPQLTKLLWSKNDALEATVAEALGLIGDRDAWPAMHKMLYEMLEHGATVRVKTIQALQRMGDREMTPRVFQIVTEKVIPPTAVMPLPSYDATSVRVAALQFLMEWGDTATGEKLLKGFPDTPPRELRPALAKALTKLTGHAYEPVPDETHTLYSVESLGPVPYQSIPPSPGVRLVE